MTEWLLQYLRDKVLLHALDHPRIAPSRGSPAIRSLRALRRGQRKGNFQESSLQVHSNPSDAFQTAAAAYGSLVEDVTLCQTR